MRVSLGTAGLLGLEEIKTHAYPGLAYLMYGNKCRNNCKFCTQSTKKSSNKLSRIVWPEYPEEEIEKRLSESIEKGILKRCCIQVIDDGDKEGLIQTISKLKKTGIKIHLSVNAEDIKTLKDLFNAGAKKIAIPLDVINPKRYEEIKGGSFNKRLSFMFEASKTFRGRINTHIIIGLDETEEETVKLIDDLVKNNIGVSLFALTPVPGSALEKKSQPDPGSYRRIQIARYLICEKGYHWDDFQYYSGKIDSINRHKLEVFKEILRNGKAFKTSGCPDCNRPYYNERPGGFIYNYPRDLKYNEIVNALKVSSLWKQGDGSLASFISN